MRRVYVVDFADAWLSTGRFSGVMNSIGCAACVNGPRLRWRAIFCGMGLDALRVTPYLLDMETQMRVTQMTQLKMIATAAELVKAGKTNEEIRAALFNLKGARVAQINKTMDLLA